MKASTQQKHYLFFIHNIRVSSVQRQKPSGKSSSNKLIWKEYYN